MWDSIHAQGDGSAPSLGLVRMFWQHAQVQMLRALVRTLVQTTTCTSALAAHVVSPSVRVFMLCGRCARIPLVHDKVKHKLL